MQSALLSAVDRSSVRPSVTRMDQSVRSLSICWRRTAGNYQQRTI